MTPEELEGLILDRPPQELVAVLAVLDEKERKVLATTAQRIAKEIGEIGSGRQETIAAWQQNQKVRMQWRSKHRHAELNTELALLGLGNAAQAKRTEIWRCRHIGGEHLLRVLADRRPAWLQTWVEKKIAGEWPELSWELTRRFVTEKLIEKPDSDDYIRMFANQFNGWNAQKIDAYVPLSEHLASQSDLIEEELWRLFEVENSAFVYDWGGDNPRRPKNYETWQDAIIKLAADGVIDRGRVLDGCVAGLGREFKQTYLSAYGKLHDALEPSGDEMKARERAYRDLLTSPVGPVISFAVKSLAKLAKPGELDDEQFLAAAAPVFTHRAKGNAARVLKLAQSIVKRKPELSAAASMLAIDALSHPSVDVQEQALALIATADAPNDDLAAQFERSRSFLSPSLVQKAESVMALLAPDRVTVDAAATPAPEVDDIARELEQIPPDIRSLLNIASASELPPSLDFDVLAVPSLAAHEPLNPVQTTEELFELASRLVEQVGSAMDVEMLLDGISRLGTDRSGNFARLAEPLLERVAKWGEGGYGLIHFWSVLSLSLADLLHTWLKGKRHHTPASQWHTESGPVRFVQSRIRDVIDGVVNQKPRPLLATPTHGGGWLDAETFVTRVAAYQREHREPGQADLMQALLRLAPANRKLALQRAAQLPGDLGRLTCFALGGDESPGSADGRQAHLWLCAARARKPQGAVVEELNAIAAKVPGHPDLLYPARYAWSAAIEVNNGYRHRRFRSEVDTANDNAASPSGVLGRVTKALREKRKDWALWPTALLHRRGTKRWASTSDLSTPWVIEWFGSVWPLNHDPWYAYAVQPLSLRMDDGGSREAPYHAFLDGLFEHNRAWSEPAHLVLAMGLVTKAADTRGLALDALIEGIENGYADLDKLSEIFIRFQHGECLMAGRFAEAFRQVAAVSELHRWWAATLVCAVIGAMDDLPKDAHHLLELAVECLVPLGSSLPAAAASVLAAKKGASKTAKLARRLTELSGAPLGPAGPAAIAQALRGRITLAKSWTS